MGNSFCTFCGDTFQGHSDFINHVCAKEPVVKLKTLSIVVFDPYYAEKHPESYDKHPIKLKEQVLYLGEISNCSGHCAVAKYSGEVVWMCHPDDFRMATEEEL